TGFFFKSEFKVEERRFIDVQRVKEGYRIEFVLPTTSGEEKSDFLTVKSKKSQIVTKQSGQLAVIQGLVIQDVVPTAKDRIYFSDLNIFETYSNIVRVLLQKSSKQLELVPVDGALRTLEKGSVEWQIGDLETDKTKKAFLAVKRNNRELVAYA